MSRPTLSVTNSANVQFATGWLRAIFLSEAPDRTSLKETSRHLAAPDLR
jgi:hypothetical protein